MLLPRIPLPFLGRDGSVLAMNLASAPNIADRQSLAAFHAIGGNIFHLHGEGGETESRNRFGQWLSVRRAHRHDLIVLTQVCHEGYDPVAETAIDRLAPSHLRHDISEDLALLQTDYLDAVYFAGPPALDFDPEPLLYALAAEISQRRIRAFGVFNWPPELIRRAIVAAARSRDLPGISFIVTTELSLAAPTRPRWPGYVPFADLRPVVTELQLTVFAWLDQANLFVPTITANGPRAGTLLPIVPSMPVSMLRAHIAN